MRASVVFPDPGGPQKMRDGRGRAGRREGRTIRALPFLHRHGWPSGGKGFLCRDREEGYFSSFRTILISSSGDSLNFRFAISTSPFRLDVIRLGLRRSTTPP